MGEFTKQNGRRALLRYLAGTPFVLGVKPLTALQSAIDVDPDGHVIAEAGEALSVFDFDAVAKRTLPPAHYGYLATGVDSDLTLRANREAFTKIAIRARRLVDVTNVDLTTSVFGERWQTPIALAPVGSQKAFHAEGEVAVGRAAGAKKHTQILSTMTTASVEEVTEAKGSPVWYQLYPTADWNVTKAIVGRAERAGCPVVVLTVDLPVISNRETAAKFARVDSRECSVCHEDGPTYFRLRRKPMFDGIDVKGLTDLDAPALTWSFLKRLRDATSMKVVVKGIVTGEDAALCVENGADGIIVSNHGGRAEESGRGTIESLPEVIAAAAGRVPVLIDSGFRRGTDIFKALALGASAVCVGRPYIWGLASFGQEGVEAVLDVLRGELALAMRLAGATSVSAIDERFVRTG